VLETELILCILCSYIYSDLQQNITTWRILWNYPFNVFQERAWVAKIAYSNSNRTRGTALAFCIITSHVYYFTQVESLHCIDFLGRKINLSRISPAKRSWSGPNSVYVDMSRGDNVQGILGKMGTGQVFCVVIQTTFRQLRNGRFSPMTPNLATKCNLVSRRGRHFRKFSL